MNRSIALRLFQIALLLSCSRQAIAADVSLTRFEGICGLFNTLTITGEITTGDSLKVSEVLERIGERSKKDFCGTEPMAAVESRGGSVEEAMKIGRLLKKYSVYVAVPLNSECVSACVFLIAGGVKRGLVVGGNVGVHRPYFREISQGSSLSDISKVRLSIVSNYKKYFEEMDINPAIVDEMLATPPDEIKYLSIDQLTNYRLTVDDANYEESETLRRAAFFGLSSLDYRKRMAKASTLCKSDAPENESCRLAVLLDISIREAGRRINLYKARCNTQLDQDPLIDYRKTLSCMRSAYRLP